MAASGPKSHRVQRRDHHAADRKLFETGPSEAQPPGQYKVVCTDAFAWLESATENHIHAVVTDPPYGLIEFDDEQLAKRKNGRGGVWRIPPAFDGCRRAPLPRFTVLDTRDVQRLREFFSRLARGLARVLVPGGHVFIATNPLVSYAVYEPFLTAGFEKRGEIIRLVQTLRGGDRPKNAEREFPEVTVMPRSCWEPWGLFRKPCEGTVRDNLRKWKADGLRRISDEEPFKDVISCGVARSEERRLAPHPSLKPQKLMRRLVTAALPLAEGLVLDPFMGSGATIAAAVACGFHSVGLESNGEYFEMAVRAIPQLSRLLVREVD